MAAVSRKKPVRITAADIRAAMSRRYSQPEWAILFEVRNATGHSYRNRTADAIAMSLWPSRGLELHGFEIKVSRNDWRREAKDPEKAEIIAAFCDRWWVVAPPDIVPVEELPPAWGLLEWGGKRFAIKRDAGKTEAKTVTRPFLAALLRRAHVEDSGRANALAKQLDGDREEEFERRITERVDRATRKHLDLTTKINAFEKAAGVELSKSWSIGDIGQAVKIVQTLGVGSVYGLAERLIRDHETAAKNIRAALDASGVKFEEPAKELNFFAGKK